MPKLTKVLILGSGPAGCTAAIYAARANLAPMIVAGNVPGGQLTTTTDVENWPGSPTGAQGPALMDDLQEHAKRFGTQIVQDTITSADFSKRPFVLKGEFGETYIADCVIIATGATAKAIGLQSELDFQGRGVSGCATCDGFFYKDMDCCIVGGGNTALEEALFLSAIARKVYLIHRRDTFRADPILQDRLATKTAQGNVELRLSSELDEVIGDHTGVTAVRIRRGRETETLAVSGCFIAIGHHPNTATFAPWLTMRNGYICTGQNSEGFQTMTSIPGIFAAGDVQDSVYRQAITSAGSGCMAALDARRYLELTHAQTTQ